MIYYITQTEDISRLAVDLVSLSWKRGARDSCTFVTFTRSNEDRGRPDQQGAAPEPRLMLMEVLN